MLRKRQSSRVILETENKQFSSPKEFIRTIQKLSSSSKPSFVTAEPKSPLDPKDKKTS
jgi:hypothetical protein